MNFSLVVLCWIAISSLFGVFFGYSSLGLTTSTSMAALFLGLVLAGLPLFFHRDGAKFEALNRRHFIAIGLSVFFLLFALREFSQVIFVANDEVRVISPNNLGDIAFTWHISTIWPAVLISGRRIRSSPSTNCAIRSV